MKGSTMVRIRRGNSLFEIVTHNDRTEIEVYSMGPAFQTPSPIHVRSIVILESEYRKPGKDK